MKSIKWRKKKTVRNPKKDGKYIYLYAYVQVCVFLLLHFENIADEHFETNKRSTINA